MSSITQLKNASRANRRAAYVADMAEGRRLRPTTIPARKGKGSYTRRVKHRRDWS